MLSGMIFVFIIAVTDYSIFLKVENLGYYLFLFYFPLIFSVYPLIYLYLVSIAGDENKDTH